MKFTRQWLQSHLPSNSPLAGCSNQELAATLTMAGLEVEAVVDRAQALSAFSVARILDSQPHPNADKLRVCRVETRDGMLEIVCGAPNAVTGLTTIYAPIGAYVPGIDVTLEARAVRGVVSHGMLCSGSELELEANLPGNVADGILDLPGDLAVGLPASAAFGLEDVMFDIEVTPNRPDWLGVRGIARDLAAKWNVDLLDKPIEPVEGRFPCPIAIEIAPDEASQKACPVFAGRWVRNVRNRPSPLWLQKWLKASGLKSINALVDVTNFLSRDRARPLHVYDGAQLGSVIRARMGREGESFVALDDKTYAISPDMCVIATQMLGDPTDTALGLGGVMGGASSGVRLETQDVFIESAWFDPILIAQTGRQTSIVSDAQYRFARGIDPQSVLPGLEMATQMILDLCGGEPSEIVVAGKVPDAPHSVDFALSRVEDLTGMVISDDETLRILRALGFQCDALASNAKLGQNAVFRVTPPSWRRDIEGSADLVEEIARIYGFDHLAATSLPRLPGRRLPAVSPLQNRGRIGRRVLASLGYLEAVTWSFCSRAQAEQFGGGAGSLVLDNPIAAELDCMRPSILPNLLRAAARNADRGRQHEYLFELGPVYRGDGENDQGLALTALRMIAPERHWQYAMKEADLFDIKADLFAVLRALDLDPGRFQIAPAQMPYLHPGKSGVLRLGPKNTIATFGEIHPRTLRALDLDGLYVGFELQLDAIPFGKSKGARTRPIFTAQELMPVRRDFAFVVGDDVQAARVQKAVESTILPQKDLIQSVQIFDLYRGKGVAAEHYSLALEVVLQPSGKSLTDAEIEAVSALILQSVSKACGATLR